MDTLLVCKYKSIKSQPSCVFVDKRLPVIHKECGNYLLYESIDKMLIHILTGSTTTTSILNFYNKEIEE